MIESIEINLVSGTNSVVECDLAKVEVAGSNPVSRFSFQSLGNSISRFYPIITQLTGFQFTNADSSWVTASMRLSSEVLV